MLRLKMLAKLTFPILALLVLPSLASANSITTLFASNNGGAMGGAVYFDVTVGANALEITGFETNTAETNPFSWEVLTLVGSRVGNETNPGAWTSVATGSGVGAGLNLPSVVTLDNTFVLAANTTYGMMLVITGAGHDYTNGNGANQNYANADLALEFGSATNSPFNQPPSGGLYEPRVWNGTIVYDLAGAVPEPSAVLLFGIGAFAVGAATKKARR